MEPSQEVLQEAWKWILAQSPCGTSNLLSALRTVMEELLKNSELLEISCSACMLLQNFYIYPCAVCARVMRLCPSVCVCVCVCVWT